MQPSQRIVIAIANASKALVLLSKAPALIASSWTLKKAFPVAPVLEKRFLIVCHYFG
ncbi:hypothetical protein [Limosilactobacillus sp.]|uniref:hypothetical protein n=1 Tax=Limosilactobacillus sp. TaxID=2773925 RepID=UPI00345E7C50